MTPGFSETTDRDEETPPATIPENDLSQKEDVLLLLVEE
jgi:hypothetical protein